ncbi:MAG: TM2 domain-containing protein [Eubacteriales bacterium]
MAKVIQISGQTVYIGLENGQMQEVSMSSFNFAPNMGDEVEVFGSGDRVIVSKKTPSNGTPGGININVDNSSNNSSSNMSSNVNQNSVYVAPPAPRPVQRVTVRAFIHPEPTVNKMLYLILCFCLGMVGVHKFYSGKVGMGVLYIILSVTGITILLCVVDFFVALGKTADDNGNIPR